MAGGLQHHNFAELLSGMVLKSFMPFKHIWENIARERCVPCLNSWVYIFNSCSKFLSCFSRAKTVFFQPVFRTCSTLTLCKISFLRDAFTCKQSLQRSFCAVKTKHDCRCTQILPHCLNTTFGGYHVGWPHGNDGDHQTATLRRCSK